LVDLFEVPEFVWTA